MGYTATARFVRLDAEGKDTEEVFETRGSVVRIGTVRSNDITFAGDDAQSVGAVHAKIMYDPARGFTIFDNTEDEYGTFVNGMSIERSPIMAGDELRFGEAGPRVRFEPTGRAATETFHRIADDEDVDADKPLTLLGMEAAKRDTLALRTATEYRLDEDLSIGREADNDVVLDDPQVSALHARIVKQGEGHVLLDEKSLNGVFVGAKRVTRHELKDQDLIHIGPYLLAYAEQALYVYDAKMGIEIDVVNLTRVVGKGLKLLDDVSMRIGRGELIGILGPSGAGKSTLLRALNGLRPATKGQVLVNGVDLYQNYSHLKRRIGYVPQDDIIHLVLSAKRTLEYVSLLRLPTDTKPEERADRIRRVLELLELSERKDVHIHRLSGGQRKRVSLGVELITEPNLIFLDEPTAGLDPGLESKMMVLFKELAQQGRTVLVTTHLMENVDLFDKLIVLVRGRLAFYGTPREALEHFGIVDIKQIFGKIAQQTADEWRRQYVDSDLHDEYVLPAHEQAILSRQGAKAELKTNLLRKTRPTGAGGGPRQLKILTQRYLEIILRDRRNTLLLLMQAPIIALFVGLAMKSASTVLFMLSLSAIWFGTSNAAKEIIKELPIYRRERMVNLGLFSYLLSKIVVLMLLATVQCGLLLAVLYFTSDIPGNIALLFLALMLTSLVALLMGLTISAMVGSTDKANAVVPLVLIPQVLFAGIYGPLTGASGLVSVAMPNRWSYDLMRRIVMETHDRDQPPLIDFDEKNVATARAVELDKQTQQHVAEMEKYAAEVPEARDRMQASWAPMRKQLEALHQERAQMQAQYERVRGTWDGIATELQALKQQQQVVSDSYGRIKVQIEDGQAEFAAIDEKLERQRKLVEKVRAELEQKALQVAKGDLDLNGLVKWVTTKQKQVEEIVLNYREIETLARKVQSRREPLKAEQAKIEAAIAQAKVSEKRLKEGREVLVKEHAEAQKSVERAREAERVLTQGRTEIEAEIRDLETGARRMAELQAKVKANGVEIREIQRVMGDNLRAKRYVFLREDDSIERDIGALLTFCLLFLGLTVILQRRRDREG